jgi:hypothetical protein
MMLKETFVTEFQTLLQILLYDLREVIRMTICEMAGYAFPESCWAVAVGYHHHHHHHHHRHHHHWQDSPL